MKLRADPGIVIERAHSNGNLVAIGPIATEQTRAAVETKRFHGPFPFAVNANQLRATQQPKLFLQNSRLSTDRGARMFPATIAMAMARAKKWRLDFEPHAAAETTAPNPGRHIFFLPSIHAIKSAAVEPS
jgi:hypothetical protein